MTRYDYFNLLSIGYLIFTVLFTRVGFLLNITINSYTLLCSFILYVSFTFFITSFNIVGLNTKNKLFSFIGFVVVSLCLYAGALLIAYTYDLSWDGQGYHQTAIIALSQGWNPIYQPEITLLQRLDSQIFAEGYPSALWEIQSSIYSSVGKINAGKIVNVLIGMISFGNLYILLRHISLNRLLALTLSFLIVAQPIYLIQLLTFMQDGFGYQLTLIAGSSLILFIVNTKKYWPIINFVLAILLLASTKYSHLPIVLLLVCIFSIVLINRIVNKDFQINKTTLLYAYFIFFIFLVFVYSPYVKNSLFYSSPFYPTNIPQLMGAVAYNNIPLNLDQNNKIQLLLYGLFSKSQSKFSGDPTNQENVATLKIPFTFTFDEVRDAGGLYNNRVGAGGFLFSGIIIIAVLMLLVISYIKKSQHERYIVYAAYFLVIVVLFLSLLTPAPNLLRYSNFLQLIPFLIFIPIITTFKQFYVKIFSTVLIVTTSINVIFFTCSVYNYNRTEHSKISIQIKELKATNRKVFVKAQQFYSNYILLKEHGVPFQIVDTLPCGNKAKDLVSSSNTTHYCY